MERLKNAREGEELRLSTFFKMISYILIHNHVLVSNCSRNYTSQKEIGEKVNV
jgi:hypothetical protein